MRLIGNVEKDAQVRAVASGALPSGDTVVVNSDGTVSVVAGSGDPQGVTSLTKIANNQEYPRAVYDSNAQKIVYFYRDGSNAGRGAAVVGTVSGSSISFGTPTLFTASGATANWISAAFDEDNNKVIVSYARDYGPIEGWAVVGTISGTSISFGSEARFETGLPLYTSTTYDTTNNKVVIAYKDQSNSNYGTAVVGTVSGTSISFGTPAVFSSSEANYTNIDFDSSAGKVGIIYNGWNGSSYEGFGVVGTVSGTSISYGTPVGISTSAYWVIAGYDASAGSFSAVYYDSTSKTYVIAGQISGTSFSFGSAVEIGTSTMNARGGFAYDANAQKSVFNYSQATRPHVLSVKISGTTVTIDTPTELSSSISYRGGGNVYVPSVQKVVLFVNDTSDSESGNYYIFTTDSLTTNLTSENFLGFADSGYADGQSAAINSTCTVDRNQTSLTAGQTYYVQADGSLGTTAANPSVVAGTAISSTEIIVKG
jgi:hypothetical protein